MVSKIKLLCFKNGGHSTQVSAKVNLFIAEVNQSTSLLRSKAGHTWSVCLIRHQANKKINKTDSPIHTFPHVFPHY